MLSLVNIRLILKFKKSSTLIHSNTFSPNNQYKNKKNHTDRSSSSFFLCSSFLCFVLPLSLENVALDATSKSEEAIIQSSRLKQSLSIILIFHFP